MTSKISLKYPTVIYLDYILGLYITFAFEKVRHVKYDDDEISNQ